MCIIALIAGTFTTIVAINSVKKTREKNDVAEGAKS
jgi:hypothetical protein